MTRHTRVDTTASAIITEADTFPPEATTPNKDDQRQGIYPLRIYEGYNYLPTAYGYKSYFGTQAELDAAGLVSPDAREFVVEDLFVYQTKSFVNILIALTSHGIYVRTDGDWMRIVELDAPVEETTSLPWTRTSINQILFLYRQSHATVFVLDDIVDGEGVSMDTFNGMAVTPERVDTGVDLPVHVYEFTPTILNMEGQVGLFRAGGSLGFWDSDDSIAWSAINDFTDFEPSLKTLANTTKLQDQIGAITAVMPHGDGFIVYCTRSVLYAREDSGALLRYTTTVVLGNVGVAYPREIVAAEPDITHYVFTSAGLMEVTNGQAQPIVPDFSDYVKRVRLPQYMQMLNNRYLCVAVMDPDFIEGNVDYTSKTVDPVDYEYEGIEIPGVFIPGYTIPGRKVCFNISDEEPDPEDILDEGVKPYHLLQFYGQWQYKGATIRFDTKKVNGEDVKIADISEGSTDARYDKVPVKMQSDEVDEFNATKQIDELVDRQIDYYLDHYNTESLDLQTKYDEYQDAKSLGTLGNKLTLVGMSSISVPYTTGQAHPAFPTFQAKALPYMEYSSANGAVLGSCLIDQQGNVYLSPNYDFVVKENEFLRNSYLQANFEDYNEWAGWLNFITGAGIDNLTCYRWVGNVNTTDITDMGLQPVGSTQIRVFEIPDSDVFYKRIDDLEYTEDSAEGYVLDPQTFDNLQPFSVEGAKLAVKVATNNTMAIKVIQGDVLEPHRLVRQFPTSVEILFYHEPSAADDDIVKAGGASFTYEDSDGIERNGGASGTATLEGGTYSLSTEVPATLTSLAESSNEDADAMLNSQHSAQRDIAKDAMLAEADSLYDGLSAQVESEIQQDFDQQAAAITADGGTITSPPGEVTYSTQPPSESGFFSVSISWILSNPVYPVLELAESKFEEEEEDLLDMLFGKIPATLPPTAVGAAAINAMDEETKRGLIAVHQHYYTRNNSKVELDPSFLILTAGRVDVPLGAPLGSIEEVIDDADFANRWFLLGYEGEPPVDEQGQSFVVPGQTVEQSLSSQQGIVCGITDDIVVNPYVRDPIVYPPWTIEVPELTWVMQNGSRAPFNPTLHGAFVFDLHLQKWGVFKGQFKHLVDYQPVNNFTPGSVSYKNFMIDGGCLTEDLEVALFNDYPEDNRLRYGKYQHVGSEFCAIEQVHVEFSRKSTGMISVQFSLDGRRLEYGHSVAKWYNEALSTTLNCDIVGQWGTITFTGHFDLAGLRVKSNPSGRR